MRRRGTSGALVFLFTLLVGVIVAYLWLTWLWVKIRDPLVEALYPDNSTPSEVCRTMSYLEHAVYYFPFIAMLAGVVATAVRIFLAVTARSK